ncbi:hypothetical protein [Amycolatopsis sp. NPDC058986]|uniref:hypothetical protein n=1 Tax=Amycolatopsis sp. NPDC058986 TaxID=3346685 RepID=UPI00366D604B
MTRVSRDGTPVANDAVATLNVPNASFATPVVRPSWVSNGPFVLPEVPRDAFGRWL